jgi:hypothetical protein
MPRYNPDHYASIAVSMEIHQLLFSACIDSGYKQEDWEIAAIAIREWIVRNNPNSLGTHAQSGYQWKHVFLPHGTLLRTVFHGKNHHALVEQDHILHEGRNVSPSEFANAVGGMRRNAWKSIWLLFPNASTWQLATTLRAKRSHSRDGR